MNKADNKQLFMAGAAALIPPAAILGLYYKNYQTAAIVVFLVACIATQSISIQCLRASWEGSKSTNFAFSIGSLLASLLAMAVVMYKNRQIIQGATQSMPRSMTDLSQRMRGMVPGGGTQAPLSGIQT